MFVLWLTLAFLGACGVKIERNKKKDSVFKWSGTISFISNLIVPSAHAASWRSVCTSSCSANECIHLEVLQNDGSSVRVCSTPFTGGSYEFEFNSDPKTAFNGLAVIFSATKNDEPGFIRKK